MSKLASDKGHNPFYKIEELLKTFYYHDPDELGEDAFNNLGDDEIAEAKQAINAYILGEVMELIGEDDVQKPDDDEYDYPYCTTCDMCFFDGDKSNGCECTSRNRVRQELRNKANKKFGGK